MKKILFVFGLFMALGLARSFAQAPSCSNDNGLNARIAAIENQGYTEISRQYYQVNYLIAPEPPYLTGTLEIVFVGPYCGPACTPAILVETFDAIVTNDRGNCVWNLNGN